MENIISRDISPETGLKQTQEAVEDATRRTVSLQNLTTALSDALTPTQVAEVVVEQGVRAIGACSGLLVLLNEESSHLELLRSVGYDLDRMDRWQRFPLDAPVPLAKVVQTGNPIFIESVEILRTHYPDLAQYQMDHHHAFAVLPLKLKRESKAIGALGLSFSESRSFNEDDCAFLLTLVQQAAQTLERAQLYEAERTARAEAEAAQQRLALLAETNERNRLAQELHDNVAQALGYLNLKITTTNTLLSEGQLAEAQANLRELKQIVGEVYTDVREEIFNLRDKTSLGLGFMEVLHKYIAKYKRFYKLDIQLKIEAEESLFKFPSDVSTQIIRIIQEALINVRKHAQVKQVTIYLGRAKDQVYISVEDKGQGFDLDQVSAARNASFGLEIMQERVESIGGSLEIDSAPGQGSRLVIYVPLTLLLE